MSQKSDQASANNVQDVEQDDGSCPLCSNIDDERMVQCDRCDVWYHFGCVGVDSDVSKRDWMCEGCVAKDNEDDPERTVISTDATAAARKVCAKKISKCRISKEQRLLKLDLMRLEEEKEAHLRYLNKKFKLLALQGDLESENDGQIAEWKAHDGLGEGLSMGGRVDYRNVAKVKQREEHMVLKQSVDSLPTKSTIIPDRDYIHARQVVSRELPMFSGRPEEWPLFFSSFETSTRLCGLTNEENLLRLQRSLKGKALEYVSQSLTLPALVPEIISTLKMIFGRPEHILNILVAKVRAAPPVNPNKLESLINFSLEVKSIIATIEASGLGSHMNNPSLVQELIEKLPVQRRIDWSVHIENNFDVNLKTLSDWLYKIAQAASRVLSVPVSSLNTAESERRKVHRVSFHEGGAAPSYSSTPNIKCTVCNELHSIVNCGQFKAMNYNDRWNFVNSKKLCRSCLRRHDARFCRDRKECQLDGCHAKHHPLLHKLNVGRSEVPVVAVHNTETSKVLYRIVPITIFGRHSSIDVYAFLDDGSGPTLIEQDVLTAIGVEGVKSDLCLRWTDGTLRTEKDSHKINLQVAPKDKINKRYSLRNVRSVHKLDLPLQTLQMQEITNEYRHLKGLPVESYRNVVPRVIIGFNNRSLAMPLSFREGKPNEPAATKTRLGWTIFGEVGTKSKTNSTVQSVNLHICECEGDVALEKLFAESMKIDNEGVTQLQGHKLNTISNIQLENSIKRDGDRFIAKLLWKSGNITLPNNYAMAYRRLCCLERKLQRDPDLSKQVNGHIVNMEAKGYINKLQKEDLGHQRKWNLPIFVVKNPNKPNKLRLVWDAAAEYNGVSLKACLNKGPDLINSLMDVLFKFRIGKVGVCGDISEMFHRISIDQEDQHSQRFLWWNGETNRQPDVYILKVMSFGASCSPSIAQYVKNSNAKEYYQEYPRAVKSIIERHYVDDMLDSVNSVEEAINLAKDVREIHKHANFHIRNWISNSATVIDALGEPGSTNNFCQAGRTVEQVVEAEKVLGMWWHTNIDSFTFNLKYTKASEDVLRGEKLPTKRQLLRLLMSIFDPLGFLNFFTVYMKILMQNIWRSGIGWDDPIPQEFSEAWSRWMSTLQNVERVEIPRCYFGLACSDSSKVGLHVFVDASEKAYAAVAYFRIESTYGTEIVLVCSKTKVAPLRPISIPRMELMAAVLGSRLGNAIVKAHDLEIETINYWTDSKTVLLWLHGDPRAYKQFVMFRIGEIQETTNVASWKYVPSKENVADLATKWNQHPQFHPSSPWFAGPTFLSQPSHNWPSTELPQKHTPNDELRYNPEVQQHLAVQLNDPVVDFNRFSRWERLTSCMGYVKRFISILQQKKLTGVSAKHDRINVNYEHIPFLTRDELLWGHQILYRLAQSQTYSLEHRLLVKNPHCSLPKSSLLRRLSPFVDENMIIRMRGRLENMIVSNTSKNPIIMPKMHHISRLIVEWYHRKFRHGNHETVINEIFQIFHIPGLRNLLRTIRSKCQICRIRTAIPKPPEMGPLPTARLSPYTRPFSYVGVDFFGPFAVTIGRRTEKRYGAVFTCLTCRAVHIEVAHSLTMNSCVMVIRNFIARRGHPLQFYSDNGTNLKAAEKELREAHDRINFKDIQAKFTTQHTKWKFIPPASPHMGGAWERMVRSIKTVLYQIITPDAKLTDEKLNNLLIEVESIINSRPLTYLSLDTAEQEVLTPNHFILGSSSGSKPPGLFDTSDKYIRSSWRHSQLLADTFWKRWVSEVLPTLTRRTNWFEKAEPIKVGDIVVVVDPNLPRHCWPKGIVEEAIKGKDGQVRSAVIRTSSGKYHRPAAKIAVLDVRQDGGGVGNPI